MINILTVGFKTEKELQDWTDGYTTNTTIQFNNVVEEYLGEEVIEKGINRVISLMEYLGEESCNKGKCLDYINGINQRLTEMVKNV